MPVEVSFGSMPSSAGWTLEGFGVVFDMVTVDMLETVM